MTIYCSPKCAKGDGFAYLKAVALDDGVSGRAQPIHDLDSMAGEIAALRKELYELKRQFSAMNEIQ